MAPNPQSPIPNPQSPIPIILYLFKNYLLNYKILKRFKNFIFLIDIKI